PCHDTAAAPTFSEEGVRGPSWRCWWLSPLVAVYWIVGFWRMVLINKKTDPFYDTPLKRGGQLGSAKARQEEAHPIEGSHAHYTLLLVEPKVTAFKVEQVGTPHSESL